MRKTEKLSTRVGKQAALNFVFRIVGLGAGFFSDIIFARLLGRDAYGVFNLAASLISIFGILAISGFPRAMVRIIAKQSDFQTSAISSHIKLATGCVLFAAILGGGGILFGFEFISDKFFSDPELQTMTLPTAIQLILFSLCSLWLGVFEGAQLSSIGYLIREVIVRLLKVAFFVLFGLSLGYNAATLMWGFCLGQFVALLIYIILADRYCGLAFKIKRVLFAKIPDKHSRREFFSFTGILVSNAIIGLLMTNAAKILLGHYNSSGDVGLYSVAINLGGLLLLGLGSINTVIHPVVARLYEKNDIARLKDLYQSAFNAITMFTFPIFATLFLYAQEVLFIYGTDFVDARAALQWISAAFFITGIVGSNHPFLIMSRLYSFELVATILAGGANLFLGLLLIPKYGIVGAAFSFFCARIIMMLCRSIRLYKAYDFSHFSGKCWRFCFLIPLVIFIRWTLANKDFGSVAEISLFFFLTFSLSICVYYFLVISESEKTVIENIKNSVFKSILNKQ